MLIGAHVREDDPVVSAAERGADIVQMFLADPQGWKKPPSHPQAAELRASEVAVVVHSPYVVNLASLNNRVRIPSRKLVVQHAEGAAEVGAIGIVVHGGHVAQGEDAEKGFDNWRKFVERQEGEGGFAVPVFIENTAGGENAMARSFEALARLWDAVGEFGVGFCLDTCHAFAAGLELVDVVERAMAITGRIDLVHLNDSRDEFGSTRDRHANIGKGTIDPDELAAVCAAAGAPVIVETPAEGQAADISFLRDRLGLESPAAASVTNDTLGGDRLGLESPAAASVTNDTLGGDRLGLESPAAASVTNDTLGGDRLGLESPAAASVTNDTLGGDRLGLESPAAASVTDDTPRAERLGS